MTPEKNQKTNYRKEKKMNKDQFIKLLKMLGVQLPKNSAPEQIIEVIRMMIIKWIMIEYGIDADICPVLAHICRSIVDNLCNIYEMLTDAYFWHRTTKNTTKEKTVDENSNQLKEAQKKFAERFGSREMHILRQITMLSMTGQPCDITFFNRKPAINVTVDQSINLAMVYGAGTETLKQKFDNIKLSNGETIGAASIWTIHPMPKGGFSDAELSEVDMTEAEERVGPNGETLREMIRNTYRCESREEEDRFLRRFIAS